MGRAISSAFIALFVWLTPSSLAADEPSEVTVLVVGDSTVAEWPETSEKRGWGQKLALFLDNNVVVINRAQNGRSSKSFIELYDPLTQTTAHLWNDAIALAPDYVLIQFGHNDNPGKPSETLADPVPDPLPVSGLGSDPLDWYRNNMRTYVNDSLAIGALPILVTPMERRNFDPQDPSKIKRINEPYAVAAREIASELGVPLVDLHAFSIELYEGLYQLTGDPSGSEYLHSPGDVTHFSAAGARVYAEEVAHSLDGTPLYAYIGGVSVLPSTSTPAIVILVLGIVALARRKIRAGEIAARDVREAARS